MKIDVTYVEVNNSEKKRTKLKKDFERKVNEVKTKIKKLGTGHVTGTESALNKFVKLIKFI